jgi:hypothetical protein
LLAASRAEPHGVCRARGIWTRGEVWRGTPSRVLDEAPRAFRADLLMMVTRPVGRWDAFSAGSITPQLLRTPRPPLLLLRSGPDAPYSARAIEVMMRLGFQSLYHMAEGILRWEKMGYPLFPPSGTVTEGSHPGGY